MRRGCGRSCGSRASGAADPGVDLAAYRLVQEALTNSLRHAGPQARAWVTVRHEPGELAIQIEDDGLGPAAAAPMGNRAVTVWWVSASVSPSMVDF
ncbi:ATP-binding protein [Streptosporangium lutulentum]